MEEQKILKRRNKAIRQNNEGALVNACTDLANLYVDNGRYDFAIEEFTTVANIYKKQKKYTHYAIVNRGIGEAYLGLQKFDKALHHQKIYLDTVRELKNNIEEQRALATIGHTYLSSYLDSLEPDTKNLHFAKKFFMKSLGVAQSLNEQTSKLEIADMSARLFCNLGVVQESLGDFDEGSALINKSINLCKVHDLYEQLQRGYVAFASLLVKRGENKLALQQYNLAADAAKKIRSKPGLLAGVLLSKSEILIKMGDLCGAKNTLLKAYKLKVSDKKEHKTIENNLRVVASMRYNEDKILVTEDTDYKTLKHLYEKMGDGACELKLFEKALYYYQKMLDSAVKAGLTGSDLATCYYSLAETFKDNNQFGEAVNYFEKELEHSKNFKDGLNTLSKIADTKEAANEPVSEVRDIYYRAIQNCQKEGNKHEEGRMVKRFITYLRRQKQHSDAFQWEQTLAKLNYESSDSEDEGSDVQTGSVVGTEIDLDAITDASDDSDVEQPSKMRRRNKISQIKRNLKGETQLHTACIKGQLNVVRHLLEQGHPVNVRDNCGWLPLHEACIHGHIDVVRLLLDKGAAINDRGGTQCEGITSLHDAASNGHMSIIQLLLDRGANAIAKTDEGNTILDFLTKWRSGVHLDDKDQCFYDCIVEQISQALEKAGHVTENAKEIVKETTPIKNLRRTAVIRLQDEDTFIPLNSKDKKRSKNFGIEDETSNSSSDHVNDYRDVIEGLKHRNELKPRPKPTTVTKKSALLSSDEITEDWLEDDVGKMSKKRKTMSPPKSHLSRKSKEELLCHTESFENFQLLLDDDHAPNCHEHPQSSRTQKSPVTHRTSINSMQKSPLKTVQKSPQKKRPKQAKLTHFDHIRTLVEADSTSSSGTSRINGFTLTRRSSFDIPQSLIDPTVSVDVRIDKKLYRVPILLSQVSTHTIKWLADEAAMRYARKEYIYPTLELETKNGAILADDDPLTVLFLMGASHAEEIEGRIVKQSVPPIIDRFKEACQDMLIAPCDDICQTLQKMSVSLDLSNKGLKGTELAPLCRILNRQVNLLELDLSRNFLTCECFQFLAVSMASMESLSKLSLNCTGLKSQDVQTMINNLSPHISYKVIDLNLGDNFLGDQCLESLAVLTRRFQLKKLNLSGNKFTGDALNHSFNQQLTLHLDQLEEFDISDNELSNEALIKILSWLHLPNIITLNVSRNMVSDGFLRQLLEHWTEHGKLKICKLSRCCVQDEDMFDLLRTATSLEVLDLSYNDDLTCISLRKLLQSNIPNMDLYGCRNIFQYFTQWSKYIDESSHYMASSKTLKLTISENCDAETECLIQLWKNLYGNKAVVELTSCFLCLSVCN